MSNLFETVLRKDMDDITEEEVMKEITSGYQFTQDWFTRHKVLWDTLMDMAQPRKVLEIGSFEGRCILRQRCQ